MTIKGSDGQSYNVTGQGQGTFNSVGAGAGIASFLGLNAANLLGGFGAVAPCVRGGAVEVITSDDKPISRYEAAMMDSLAKKDAEISMLRRYDYIITLTDVDKKILSKYIPEENIYVSPAVIAETRRLEFRDCGAEFVFLGGADHFPNMDGVDWLCREIIPELRKVLDGFRIYVVGKWNQYQQKMLGNIDPSIVFTGFIQDLNAFQNGKISIIPIRIGSGMRMKILDAVISGSPFITTTKGQEGMGFVDGVHCCIADTPVAFAGAMAKMASDRAQQKALIMAAREKVSIEYNTDVMLKKRENFYTLISESH